MSNNELFATAAHLHVLLRRKTGRVTDTEWMATNPEYARAMVALASDLARREGLEDVQRLADKLAALIPSMSVPVRKPLLALAAERIAAAQGGKLDTASGWPSASPVSGFRDSRPAFGDSESAGPRGGGPGQRYVGGIR